MTNSWNYFLLLNVNMSLSLSIFPTYASKIFLGKYKKHINVAIILINCIYSFGFIIITFNLTCNIIGHFHYFWTMFIEYTTFLIMGKRTPFAIFSCLTHFPTFSNAFSLITTQWKILNRNEISYKKFENLTVWQFYLSNQYQTNSWFITIKCVLRQTIA